MKTHRLIILPLVLVLAGCAGKDKTGGGTTGGGTSTCANPELSEAARERMFAMADEANVRPAIISGLKKKNIAVKGYAVAGDVLYEGDIVVGKIGDGGTTTKGVVITGAYYRWPNGDVPYVIDSSLPDQGRVHDAIRHWEQKTALRFPEYDPARHRNYVRFVAGPSSGACSSPVGRQGGEQRVQLAGGCRFGQAVHEIGHAVGLWHEQSREDRAGYVCILWNNISPRFRYNFNQNISNGDDVGPYDYDSIMHYGDHDFSINGQPTILPVTSGVRIGQRSHLSAGDIATVRKLYTGIAPADRF